MTMVLFSPAGYQLIKGTSFCNFFACFVNVSLFWYSLPWCNLLRIAFFRLDALALSVIAMATWLAGRLSVTAGIVSKRLNVSENFFRPFDSPIIEAFGTPYADTKFQGEPHQRGVKYTGGVKIGDFRAILDVDLRLSRKRCEIGRWLLWNVNRKSWVPDWMV